MRVTIKKGYKGGKVDVPPSKSMAHRALICAALSGESSTINGIIPSDDMRATVRAMGALGAKITCDEERCTAHVTGVFAPQSTEGCSANEDSAQLCVIDCAESGSTLRFLIPIVSVLKQRAEFVCHGRLPQRPQSVYEKIFKEQGLLFEQSASGFKIDGAIKSGAYNVDGNMSSQFISGLLFALALLPQNSEIRINPPFESKSYVDMTIKAMADFGVAVKWEDEYTLSILGGQNYKNVDYSVEADSSQAAFFAVLAACVQSGKGAISLGGLCADTLQGDDVIFDVLKGCGANLCDTRQQDKAIEVSAPQNMMTASEIDIANCPDLGPVLMVLAAFCNGDSVLKNAARLRMKESDRTAAMESELCKLGVKIHSDENNVYIKGNTQWRQSSELFGHADHRIVMALCVAAAARATSCKDGEEFVCTIEGAQAINKSYPNFFEHLSGVGVCVEVLG